MKQKLTLWINKYLNDNLGLREQIFHQLLLIGMVLGVVIGISSIITNAGIASIIVNFFASAAAFAMLEYSIRTGPNKLFYIISVILVFMIVFPILFFTSGGPHSGTPSFFVFAIVFTIFMLEGKSMYVIATLEIALYIGICVFAYRYPETVSFFKTERDTVADIVIGFTVSGIALGVTVFRYTRIYDKKQRQLSEAYVTLDRVNRTKTEFLQDIKHEIRNPLTVIALGIDFIHNNVETGGGPQKTNEALNNIQDETMRLGRMINSMVEMAVSSERLANREKIDFAIMLNKCAEAFRFQAEQKHNTLRVEIAPGLPFVYAEREQLEHIPVNLLSNSIDCTQDGDITIAVTAEEGYITVRVHDTGEGVPPEILPRIFERGVSGKGGKGYGLSICKTIVEAHGGEINMESVIGRGATVTFTIPVYGGQDEERGEGV